MNSYTLDQYYVQEPARIRTQRRPLITSSHTMSQSNSTPIPINCSFIFEMFSTVHTPGSTPRSIAAFSAGRPKASHPIGCKTLYPFIRLKRARTSEIVYTRTCPICREPDG